jgi:hypothetical protein
MPAGATYEPIATQTITGTSTTSVTFSSLGTYDDIVAIMNMGVDSAGGNIQVRFNGDSGNNYSNLIFYGLSSTNATAQYTSLSQGYVHVAGSLPTIVGTITELHIPNYRNTTHYKTAISRYGNYATEVDFGAFTWRSGSAITSINFSSYSAAYKANSTITLYGITKA